MKVGVLSLQGDYPEQAAAMARVTGPEGVGLVRRRGDLEEVDALLLPGGESTAIADLLELAGLREPLEERIRDGLPVLATCAGLILLARRIEESPSGEDPHPLGAIDVTVRRNDYGRQAESFESPVRVQGLDRPFPGVFIRAPRISAVGRGAEVIARRGTEVVGVRSGTLWGLTFHPELSGDTRLHELWLREAVTGPQRAVQRKRKSPTKSSSPKRTATQ